MPGNQRFQSGIPTWSGPRARALLWRMFGGVRVITRPCTMPWKPAPQKNVVGRTQVGHDEFANSSPRNAHGALLATLRLWPCAPGGNSSSRSLPRSSTRRPQEGCAHPHVGGLPARVRAGQPRTICMSCAPLPRALNVTVAGALDTPYNLEMHPSKGALPNCAWAHQRHTPPREQPRAGRRSTRRAGPGHCGSVHLDCPVYLPDE